MSVYSHGGRHGGLQICVPMLETYALNCFFWVLFLFLIAVIFNGNSGCGNPGVYGVHAVYGLRENGKRSDAYSMPAVCENPYRET